MTTPIATTSSLFLAAMLVLPCSMASAELSGACLKDAKAQCAGVQPGGGKIRDCLKRTSRTCPTSARRSWSKR